MHGHIRNICYKLVGYPEDWKFKKKSGYSNDQGFANSRGITSGKGKNVASNVQVERGDDELGNVNAFGQINHALKHHTQGSHNTKPSYDVNSVHTNLQALAMQPTYTPDQYQRT